MVDACQQKNIPIRIGVNGGSLEKHILAKYGAPTPEAMVESALYHVRLLEKFDFDNIVISIKNSNVPRMMEAYRQLSAVTDYPLHVGVTEAFPLRRRIFSVRFPARSSRSITIAIPIPWTLPGCSST